MKKINLFILGILIGNIFFGTLKIPLHLASAETQSLEETIFDNIGPASITKTSNTRIALYDEQDLTKPSYDTSTGNLNYNITDLETTLIDAGFDVTRLTTDDIYHHHLRTVDYDVLIITDNSPKTNITNQIKEFWLGGGSILGFDSAVTYLCYYGILPGEAESSTGENVYYKYLTQTVEINARHPVSKSYSLGESVVVSSDFYMYMAWNWTMLQTTSIANDLTFVASADGDPEFCSVLAFDPSVSGGKVVTIGHDLNHQLSPDLNDMIIDSLIWLTPKMQGHILFDLSHYPFYGVDSWDTGLCNTPTQYEDFRDILVMNRFSFDKLYPSTEGNLTTNNLSPYSGLIIELPEINFTNEEVQAVQNWVSAGGGFLALGDRGDSALDEHLENLNQLTLAMGMQNDLIEGGNIATTKSGTLPMVEGCSSISFVIHGYINYTGSAFPIWNETPDKIVIAGNEFGNGRVIMIADVNVFQVAIITVSDNQQFAINCANWLTSSQDDVLILVTGIPAELNGNYYCSIAAEALLELEIPFYLTFSAQYFNISLNSRDWDLVIVDNGGNNIAAYYNDILNYIKSGGKLALYTYNYRSTTGNPLWDYLGFSYAGNYYLTPQDVYITSPSHSLFNYPIGYNAVTFQTTNDFAGTDYSDLRCHANGTQLAVGSTNLAAENKSAIILGANGKAITNAMSMQSYTNDTDDSTYADGMELWMNEIAYLVKIPQAPTILTSSTSLTGNQINLLWTEVGNAIDYTIFVNNEANFTTTNTECLLSFNENGTFDIACKARNDYGYSDYSNTISISVSFTLPFNNEGETNNTETSKGFFQDILNSLSEASTLVLMGTTAVLVSLVFLIIIGAKKKKK